MSKVDDFDNVEGLAAKFSALGNLLVRLGEIDRTRELCRVMESGDQASFGRILDELQLPMLGKCFWFREVIWGIGEKVTVAEVCRLRSNLTRYEWSQALLIAAKYNYVYTVYTATPQPHLGANQNNTPIPSGRMLDELRAAGLVACTNEEVKVVAEVQKGWRVDRMCI